MSEHKRIWLGPLCAHSDADERMWCQDPQPCDDCGAEAVEFIRKDIAAAPELYEALDEVINYLIVWMAAYGSGKNGKADALLNKCTAALAKARGEQP